MAHHFAGAVECFIGTSHKGYNCFPGKRWLFAESIFTLEMFQNLLGICRVDHRSG